MFDASSAQEASRLFHEVSALPDKSLKIIHISAKKFGTLRLFMPKKKPVPLAHSRVEK